MADTRGVIGFLILSAVLIAYFLPQYNLTGQLKQLPSPIYGGDYYYQEGAVNHVKYGGSPLESSSLMGDMPAYFVLYSFIVGNIAGALDLGAISAMLYVSEALVVASLLLTYFFLRRIFREELVAMLGVLLYLPLTTFPVLKYSNFTYVLVAPFFFLLLFNFFKQRVLKNAVLLGIAYGIGALSHMIFFVYASIMLMFLSAYVLVLENLGVKGGRLLFKKEEARKAISGNFKLLFAVFGVGLLIASAYWYKPLFVYGLKTVNEVNVWSGPGYSTFGAAVGYAYERLKGLFFNFSDPYALLRLLGLASLFFIRNQSTETKFIAFAFFASTLGALHMLVTVPIADKSFMPDYVAYFGTLGVVLFSLFSLNLLLRQKFVAPYRNALLFILVAYAAYGNLSAFQDSYKNDRWLEAGRTEPPPNLIALEGWVSSNTGVDDVFLSSNELGFALNALTGRKLVTSRRAHNSPFVDMDRRNADAAAVLYGNDSIVRQELLKKYGVKYLYWDYYWVQSEYSFDRTGRLAGTFDPLLVFDSPGYRAYFEKNNITYFPLHTWADPAMKAENIPQYDLLFIVPNQWNWEHPWSNGLDPYLKEVWRYEQDGRVLSRIYAVNA